MATLIAAADGNLTGSTTFAAAETGALSLVLNRFGFSNQVSNFTVTSPAFTVTNGKVIDAVVLWTRQAVTGSIGTVKVELLKGGVSQASVTVNKTDLPEVTSAAPCPVLFKLTTTATGDGGANWTVAIVGTGASSIYYITASAPVANMTRALRTTTAATAAAGDDLYIVGELTGAGTRNTRLVAMDSTAATAYGSGVVNSGTVNGGGIHISNWGTLTYGTGSFTSPSTWNSADRQFITLSNGDLTAFKHDWPAYVRGNTGLSTGKYYFEHTLDTVISGGNIGVATTAKSAAVAMDSGQIVVDGSGTGIFLGARSNGDKIGVAVDATSRLIWFRVAPSGNWNANATYNPATGVGGINISVLTGPLFTYFNAGPPGAAQVTMNTGASAFTGAVPSGFMSGWSTFAAAVVVTNPGTNYILRVAGDVIVYQYGTLNMGSSAATAFTPPGLTGLIGWWDLSVFASISLSGSNITGLADQSGAGNNLTSSNWPTYNATGLNSRPTMSLGGSEFMTGSTFPMGTGNTLTTFVVATMTSSANNGARLMCYQSGSFSHDNTNVESWGMNRNALNPEMRIERNNQSTPGSSTPYGTPFRMICTIDSSGVMTHYINGVAAATATAAGNWGTNGTFRVGNGVGDPQKWDGVISEFGVATGFSNAATVAELDLYLKNKWGL